MFVKKGFQWNKLLFANLHSKMTLMTLKILFLLFWGVENEEFYAEYKKMR
jgi:hypothetical protein